MGCQRGQSKNSHQNFSVAVFGFPKSAGVECRHCFKSAGIECHRKLRAEARISPIDSLLWFPGTCPTGEKGPGTKVGCQWQSLLLPPVSCARGKGPGAEVRCQRDRFLLLSDKNPKPATNIFPKSAGVECWHCFWPEPECTSLIWTTSKIGRTI